MIAALIAAFFAFAFQAPPLPPVPVSTGVLPDTVTVGAPFRAVIRLRLPTDARATFPAFPLSDTLQAVDSVLVTRDSSGTTTAVYQLVAWVAGGTPTATVPVTVSLRDGRDLVYRVALRLPVVSSVLPGDTSTIRPRPPKALVPLPRSGRNYRLLILVLVVLLILAIASWLYLRRRAAPLAEPRDPRELALRELDSLAASDLLATGRAEEFYTRVVRILRAFLAGMDLRYSEDLTTAELLGAIFESGAVVSEPSVLAALLADAEPVKFAGSVPPEEQARRFWAATRQWVEQFGASAISAETAEAG